MKKILALLVAVLATGMVSASTLYWQVDTANDSNYSGTFQYAALQAVDGSGNVSTVKVYDMESEVTSMSGKVTELGDYGTSEYSFFVELANSSGDSVYKQASPASYDSLLASGYISTGGLDTSSGYVSGAYNGASVPEPTSGVLLLIGGALLALRRRRRA